MTLLEQGAPESVEGRGILVLETERLVLRPPRFEDAAAIAALGNDRRFKPLADDARFCRDLLRQSRGAGL